MHIHLIYALLIGYLTYNLLTQLQLHTCIDLILCVMSLMINHFVFLSTQVPFLLVLLTNNICVYNMNIYLRTAVLKFYST